MSAYQPISCSFYDHLEALAVRKVAVHVLYTNAAGANAEVHTHIADLRTREGIEYMITEGGEEIRLDSIRAINGIAPDLSCTL